MLPQSYEIEQKLKQLSRRKSVHWQHLELPEKQRIPFHGVQRHSLPVLSVATTFAECLERDRKQSLTGSVSFGQARSRSYSLPVNGVAQAHFRLLRDRNRFQRYVGKSFIN